jgi:hypothetical protein
VQGMSSLTTRAGAGGRFSGQIRAGLVNRRSVRG